MIEEYKKFNPSYTSPREDIVRLVPKGVKRVLDIGCSTGALGERLKKLYPDIFVVGVEIDEEMAFVAKKRLDMVICGDVELLDLSKYFPYKYFDCIIFADVLEHLKNPWCVLKTVVQFLNDNGIVIASIPNVRHYYVIVNLLFRGYWPYNERSVCDKTHLRFFTLKNIKEMFNSCSLEIIRLERKYRIIEKPHPLNKISKYFALPLIKEFLVYQYLIVAKRKEGNS